MVFSVGGPILKDKGWFFFGHAPQYYPSERTVRWATPGTFPATQTFDNGKPNNISTNYNATTQLASSLRARFTGNNETQKGALGLPNIQPDGTSTTSAATFNPRNAGVHGVVLERLQRHRRLDAGPEDVRQRDGELPELRLAQRRRRLTTPARAARSPRPISAWPACRPICSTSGFRRQHLELVCGGGRLPALQHRLERDAFRALEGRAHLQDRRALRAHRQPGEPGPAGPEHHPQLGQRLQLAQRLHAHRPVRLLRGPPAVSPAETSRRPTSASSRRISGRSTTS